jgi:glycosyltransferase involved in cell wall biosynthesis
MVCPEFPPDSIGGGGEVFLALSRSLPQTGVQLDVLCANYRGGASDRREGDVRVREIPLVPTPSRMPYLRTTLPPTPAGIARLRATFRLASYDVAHLHGISFAMIDIVARMLHRRRIPWVFTLHGAPRTPYAYAPLGVAYTLYLHAYGGFVVRRAALRTAVSDAARQYAPIARYMADARIVPNGIDAGAYAPHRSEREIPGWPRAAGKVVLSIGRIERAKGYDTAVRALAQMRDRSSVYVILGEDCGALAELGRLAERLGVGERILALGHAGLEEKRFALRRSALVWIPSRNESFGLVALEAMAAGTPVLATAVEGLREILHGNLQELLVDPEDATSLAKKSDAMLQDASCAQRLWPRFEERVGSFRWGDVARRYAECYRDIASIAR